MSILLVEDDKKFAKNLKKALEIQGYNVDLAVDGVTGLSLGSLPKYELIVLDVMLPKLNGVSVCSGLRKNNVQIPIIMLTAKGELQDRVAGLDSGADDYLIKPFGFEELFARLRSLLRRRKTTDQPVITFGDLVVDPATRQVHRAGRSVSLTPKEYKLLVHLLRNRNNIVTRDELTSHVWSTPPLGNQLDVYIRYLRKKIDDGYAKKIIYTVKGVGYTIK